MESETLREAYNALEGRQTVFPLYEMAEGARRPRRVDVMLESIGTGGYCERLRLLSRDPAFGVGEVLAEANNVPLRAGLRALLRHVDATPTRPANALTTVSVRHRREEVVERIRAKWLEDEVVVTHADRDGLGPRRSRELTRVCSREVTHPG